MDVWTIGALIKERPYVHTFIRPYHHEKGNTWQSPRSVGNHTSKLQHNLRLRFLERKIDDLQVFLNGFDTLYLLDERDD